MLRPLLALLLVSAVLPPRTAAQSADAYVDDGARAMVRLARERRTLVDRRITAYETTVRERLSVGLRLRFAEKLLFRRESASRIRWQRDDTTRIEILGAREVAPPISGVPQVPFDLVGLVPHLAFDPTDAEMLLRVDTTSIRHPLADGAEAHYRFASGDTTVIRLPDGRTVRLRELNILPRRRDFRLIAGSFWLDAETHAVVQAYFRLAADFDLERDDPDENVPPPLEPVRADLEFVAIEYGLWELRWWLPRLVAARGLVQVGPARMPLSYERSYAAYAVRGDTAGTLMPRDTTPAPRCRRTRSINITIDPETPSDSARQAQRDSLAARRARRFEEARAAAAASPDSLPPCAERVVVTTAGPDSVLRTSAELPAAIYEDSELIPERELAAILDRVRSIPDAPWSIGRPRFDLGLSGRGLVRYNRIEGLSVGGRMSMELGPAQARAEARIGLADREPRGELSLRRNGDVLHSTAAAYRRLDAAPIARGVHGPSASIGALLLGRDEADWYDAAGLEIVVRPTDARTQWFDLRLYAERQRAVERNADFSIAHAIDSDRDFRDNFRADAADQLGATLRLRAALGQNTAAPRVAGELSLGGEVGDFPLFRPEATVRFSTPLIGAFAFGLEAGAGAVLADAVPAQARWRIGGAHTIRGYAGAAAIGDTYWRGRAELGLGLPLAKLALFSDAAWSGPRDALGGGRPLLSAGAGVSLLDGLLRIDVARALRPPTGWRLHLYLDGVL